jgi:hypothetical protein
MASAYPYVSASNFFQGARRYISNKFGEKDAFTGAPHPKLLCA